jgi:WD40 repeat protein
MADGSVLLLKGDLTKQLRSLEVSAEGEKVLALALAYVAKADLLAAAIHSRVRLFEASSGKQLREWGKAELGVSSVALSPDGKLLAVGYGGVYMHGVKGHPRSGYVNIWDTATGRLVKKLD